jgi:hypothetical protein
MILYTMTGDRDDSNGVNRLHPETYIYLRGLALGLAYRHWRGDPKFTFWYRRVANLLVSLSPHYVVKIIDMTRERLEARINFIVSRGASLDHDPNRILLEDGSTLVYDEDTNKIQVVPAGGKPDGCI